VQETADTVTLTVTPQEGAASPSSFDPGQFNMLYAFGVGEAAISIAGDPTAPERLVHTVRSAGAITQALSSLKPGDAVGVRGPYGKGWPLPLAQGKDVILVAGGLGLPPLRPILYHVLSHRDEYGRLEVAYGSRTPEDLVYYPEIQQWRSRKDLRFQVTVDTAGTGWYGDVGIVTQRLNDMRFRPSESVAYLCGPEVMLRATAKGLTERGLPPDRIFVSMERNMKCGIAQCGHCQFGPYLLCRDGPVLPLSAVAPYWSIREI
jgi:NAD(P)H-flavin reductase